MRRGLNDGPQLVMIWTKCDFCLSLGVIRRARYRVGRLYACAKHYHAAPTRKSRKDRIR